MTVTYTYVSDTRPPDPPTILIVAARLHRRPRPRRHLHGRGRRHDRVPARHAHRRAAPGPPARARGSATSARATTASTPSACGPPTRPATWAAEATRSFTLDRVAPAQPILTFEPPPLGQSPHPTWAFTVETGATARCSLDGAAAAPCSSPFAADLTLAADGLHTFSVFAVDAAGNTGAGRHRHLRRSTDRRPRRPRSPPPPASPGNDPTPTWGIELGGGRGRPPAARSTVAPYAACGTWFTADLSAAADGVHTIAVRNADAAGNQSAPTTGTYDLDRCGPRRARPSPAHHRPSNVTSPTWGITARRRHHHRVPARRRRVADVPAGSFTTTFGPGSDGVHVLTVRATDAAGNRGPGGDHDLHARHHRTRGAGDRHRAGQPQQQPHADLDLHRRCRQHRDLLARRRAVDRLRVAAPGRPHQRAPTAGTSSPCVPPTPWGTSGQPPLSTLHPRPGRARRRRRSRAHPARPASSATVSWSFTTPEGTTTRCRIDGGSVLPVLRLVDATFTTDGLHRFTVVAVDPAGNRSAATMAMYTLDRVAPVAPTITGSPTSPDRITTPQWTFVVENGIGGRVLDRRLGVGALHDDLQRRPVERRRRPPHLLGPIRGRCRQRRRDHDGRLRARPHAAWRASGDLRARGGQRRRHADLDVRRRRRRGGVVPRGRRAVGTVRRLVHRRPHRRRRRHPLPRGTRGRRGRQRGPGHGRHLRARSRGARGGHPHHGPAVPRQRHEPRVVVHLRAGHHRVVLARRRRGHRVRRHRRGGADGRRRLPGRPWWSWTRPATRASPPRTPTSSTPLRPPCHVLTSPRTPDRDMHPEWGIEVEPGAVAECSFDGGGPVACGTVFTVDLTGLDGSPPASPSSLATRRGTSRSSSPAPTSSTRSHPRPR